MAVHLNKAECTACQTNSPPWCECKAAVMAVGDPDRTLDVLAERIDLYQSFCLV